jgi:hypothetical protein
MWAGSACGTHESLFCAKRATACFFNSREDPSWTLGFSLSHIRPFAFRRLGRTVSSQTATSPRVTAALHRTSQVRPRSGLGPIVHHDCTSRLFGPTSLILPWPADSEDLRAAGGSFRPGGLGPARLSLAQGLLQCRQTHSGIQRTSDLTLESRSVSRSYSTRRGSSTHDTPHV